MRAKKAIKTNTFRLSEDKIDSRSYYGDPANRLMWSPEPQHLVEEEGAWVMITRQLPPIEGGLQESVRVGRMFYVKRHEDCDKDGYRPSGLYMVRMVSPELRELSLYPYEYSKVEVSAMLRMWSDGEIVFHPRSIGVPTMNNVLFYARSRGIGVADAMVMALGTLRGDVGWFEPRSDLAEELEEMEESVHRWKPKRTVKYPMNIHLVCESGVEK